MGICLTENQTCFLHKLESLRLVWLIFYSITQDLSNEIMKNTESVAERSMR